VDYSDSIEIAASPAVAFAAIADLGAMGRRSPENTGGQWLDAATGPALGARFSGTNARDSSAWSTVAKVSVFDPPRHFAFDVTYKRFKISRWEFEIVATNSGCRVKESWRDDRNVALRRSGDRDGFRRADFTKTSIRTTLENLRRELEGPHGGE
jgi:hypothetical protein